ncbi:MAG: hypothetical protein C0598_14125 [Marinilabiliales bacterium]|nr:MAG: hypothetical protein C0598_14125 [Marinilabiliales bacterium]
MLHRTIILFLSLLVSAAYSQTISYNFDETINWQNIQHINVAEGNSIARLSFKDANYSDLESSPFFSKDYLIHTAKADISADLINAVFVHATEEESLLLLNNDEIPAEKVKLDANIIISQKQPYANIKIIPLRWNENLQLIEKLVSFELIINIKETPEKQHYSIDYASNSVLSTGDWFKIRIKKGGIYKLTYSQLLEMGFDVNADPRKIALYGNGGGTLPEVNTDFRYDDLVENAIEVYGAEDGSFDAGDYILFYGDNPVKWEFSYSYQRFQHLNNYYDDYSYYFITLKQSPDAKRIQLADIPDGAVEQTVTTFNDYAYHELDTLNIAGSGRTWYGEVFDFTLSRSFEFDFPNIVKSAGANCYVSLASRSYSANSFLIYTDNQLQKTQAMPITANNGYEYGRARSADFDFTPKSDKLVVTLEYNRYSTGSVGYLDYIDLNVQRYLNFSGNQMKFRKIFSWEVDEVVKYEIGGESSGISVWEITDLVNPKKISLNSSGGKVNFISQTDTLREFIAFNGLEYFTPQFVEKVDNQNLHALKNIDYLIVTHPRFIDEANRLAEFHSENQDFNVYVTSPQKIYNEFSSGSQDITAIRDFAKMLYDRSDAGKELKYLLLFGDASYDYKDKLADNSNFVPCWEHTKSLNIISSIASDDYFGYLDDGEGGITGSNRVDIGIGRFVVQTIEEATASVNKSINYCTNSSANMGPWRNQITFLADDEDSNHHMHDAETLAGYLDENYPEYLIDKIYVDAYPQVSTPSGQRAPEVNSAINSKIEKGTLIFNYSGHGGELGLGHERFLEIPDINSWNNTDKLPIFITATCEFSRYDDPRRVSAGELVFLNSNGGAVALFTTARATFASSNLALNKAIYENNIFSKIDGEYPRFGDVIRRSKTLGNDNDKKFVLIGDPAVRLAYPEFNAETVKINSEFVVDDVYDTINALSHVKVEGDVLDEDGNLLSDFNGLLYPTVYDKKVEVETLGSDGGSYPEKFYYWKSVLFNGKVDVADGKFEFEFIVPRDISYNYGKGRINYYFNNDSIDGNGFYQNLIIGGFDDQATEDNQGPEIQLYFNHDDFVNGGTTDENPVLLAYVEDESGINTTGNGIGHDIMAVIDGDATKSYTLNDYYEAEVNRFNSGVINYPFFNLEDGEHTLSLRVWDINNNSSTAYLDFVVVGSEDLVISNLMNYPNPVVDNTYFVFEHNQSNNELDVEIQIYNINGRLIKTLTGIAKSKNYKSEPLEWDACSESGRKIGRGFYVYKLIVTNESGQTKTETAKLIYVR